VKRHLTQQASAAHVRVSNATFNDTLGRAHLPHIEILVRAGLKPARVVRK
jgi:hypothetical protein